MKFRRIGSMLVASILALSCVVGLAEAKVASMRYSHTSIISAGLRMSGNNAQCSGIVKPSNSINSSQIEVKLQRNVSGTWSTIKSWSGSATNGWTAQAGGVYGVTSGFEYRVVSIGRVFSPSGVLLEETSATSATSIL